MSGVPGPAKAAALAAAMAVLAGCATPRAPVPLKPALLAGHSFERDTELSGTVLLDGESLVPRGVTLSIGPGTRLVFVRRDADGDGQGDSRLRVEGTLLAAGTPEAPVIFTSDGGPEKRPAPGDWDSILANFSERVELAYALIEYSSYSLHAHFSRGRVVRCLIRGNLEGCRMGNSSFLVEGNLIRENTSKGLNFRGCANTVRDNEITANGNGVFIFEKDSGSVFRGNNIYGNIRWNFRLDDFFKGEMRLDGNWWGAADEQGARKWVYDSRQDPEIGTVHFTPSGAPHPMPAGFPFPKPSDGGEAP